jgi:glycosyltransferase involved in cell wall biosynthesis
MNFETDTDNAANPTGCQKLPLVSVIVTCFDYAKYVAQALESVARQTYRDFQCVVVDDASTDESVAAIDHWIDTRKDTRFRLVRKCRNEGQLAAIATGLFATKGEFVALLDADDVWLPDFLTKHIQVHLNSACAVSLTCSDMIQIDEESRTLTGTCNWRKLGPDPKSSYPLVEEVIPRIVDSGGALRLPQLSAITFLMPDLSWHWTASSGMVFRRAMLELVMPDCPATVPLCADHYLAQICHYFTGSILLDHALGAYRRHGRNQFAALPVFGFPSFIAPYKIWRSHVDNNIKVILDHLIVHRDAFESVFENSRVRELIKTTVRILLERDHRIENPRVKDAVGVLWMLRARVKALVRRLILQFRS